MIETTLSRVGNSMAVLLPKALRQKACIEADRPLRVESPRKGVVVITAVTDERDRLGRLVAAEAEIAARAGRTPPWPDGKNADDVIAEGKERAADELLSV